jgi:hypothetical protein
MTERWVCGLVLFWWTTSAVLAQPAPAPVAPVDPRTEIAAALYAASATQAAAERVAGAKLRGSAQGD